MTLQITWPEWPATLRARPSFCSPNVTQLDCTGSGKAGLEGDSASNWIGDPVAFEEYQRIRLGTPSPEFGDHGMDPLDLAARLVGDPLIDTDGRGVDDPSPQRG
jgi:hypothetical protein